MYIYIEVQIKAQTNYLGHEYSFDLMMLTTFNDTILGNFMRVLVFMKTIGSYLI